jgi:uncharacterized repeat protein (TIGR01451 family)
MQVVALCLLITFAFTPSAGAVPAGTVITNTASAAYDINGNPQSAYSNAVNITTVVFGTPSVIELYRYSPSSPSVSMTVNITPYFDGGSFTPAPAPTDPAAGSSIDLAVPVPLEPAVQFTQGEAVFVRLIDPDGNIDPAVVDTLAVTIADPSSAAIETILLIETGPDTGAFTGYVLSGAASETANDGILHGAPGAQFTAEYTDPLDSADTSSADFVFDPANILWVTASAGESTVSVGDYLTYTITVENTSDYTIPGVVLTVDLPLGFKYEEGTTNMDGVLVADPLISSDGRSLAFDVGDIPPGGVVTITFVSSVGAGARTGKAVALNVASSNVIVSNTVAATVRVTEDLVRTRNTIMGRVLSGACGDSGAGGVEGIRIFLEDGTRVVTDEKGRYHFEGVRSGTHVVQVDLDTVPEMYEVVACDDDTRQAGRPWSRFVDLSGGTIWRADFYLVSKAPVEGKTVLVVKTVAEPDTVTFSVSMRGDEVPFRNVRFRVTLPEGVVYEPGSSRLEGKPIQDPEASSRTLTWNIGDVPGAWEKGISFETRIQEEWDWLAEGSRWPVEAEDEYGMIKSVQGRMNEISSSASMSFDTPAQEGLVTPEVRNVLMKVGQRDETIKRKFVFRPHFGTFEAELTQDDRDALDIIAAQFNPAEITGVQVTGHTDNVPISERGQEIFKDNYELSKARARSVATYLREVWDLPLDLFTTDGKGPDEPVASNDTVRGKLLNRRVEVNAITSAVQKRSELESMDDQSVTEMVVKGLRPREVPHAHRDLPEMDLNVESEEETRAEMNWAEGADGSLDWVLPTTDFVPRVPGIKVAVRHDPRGVVRLTVNGMPAHELTFMGTEVNQRKKAAMSLWRGIELEEGDNTLKVEEINSLGLVFRSIERTIHLAGSPTEVQFLPEESNLVADGRTPPSIAVRLTDRDGHPARYRSMGQYFVDRPHEPLNPGGGNGDAFFGIEEDGVARLRLKPTSRTGEATVRVKLQGGVQAINVWLVPEKRDWILVGLAEGTAGYNVASGNMESLEDSGSEEDLYTDGRLAFFAKGRVKGEYLLTMSYDTNGPHGAAGEGHHGTIDPDTYYTLYGDAAEQDYEAPTSKKLYLKIEKDNFYALFGDTSTGLTVAELSRYDRRITGLRSELRGRNYSYNLFASETEQGFIKDEIPGDGTSGLYRLSAGEIVLNSEKVTIEVRDRFQSHVVLSETSLVRHRDYSIDYDEGTLFFKSPVPERDAGFNPVFIVVDYETTDPGATGLTYGARGEAVLTDSRLKVGLSVIHEDRGDGAGDLVGMDASVSVSDQVTVKAETASSSSELYGSESEGSAYLLEVRHDSSVLKGKVYIRQQDGEFGLGHQRGSESGMRKMGTAARYSLTDTWNLTAEVYAQENLETDEDRTVEELGAVRDTGRLEYSATVRQATDTESGGVEEQSRQLTGGVAWRSEDSRWNMKARHEQSMGDNANKAYPTRTLFGSDYRLTSSVSVSAEQEFTDGDETSVSATRLGLKATPWEGGTASSTVSRSYNENGDRIYATTGLSQTWQVNRKWQVSAGLEGATVIEENTDEPINGETAPVSSEEDYTAMSLGTSYSTRQWKANLRLEARNATSSDKWGVITGVYGEPTDGVGFTSDLKHFRTEDNSGVADIQSDLKLGLVYRPWDRYWTFLDKMQFSVDDESGGSTDIRTWKMVNNFNANYKPHDDLQLSFLLGTKYVKETIDGQVFDGYTHLVGTEGRWDLANRWDAGAWAKVLTTVETGTREYGLGASLGYGLMENVWLSFGYNLLGFEDSDFSQGDFTAQGPFVKFRLKFDQQDLEGILKN